jgi:hypothetical protein
MTVRCSFIIGYEVEMEWKYETFSLRLRKEKPAWLM